MTKKILFLSLLLVAGCESVPYTPEQMEANRRMSQGFLDASRALNGMNQAPQTQNCTIIDHGFGQYSQQCR